MEAAEFQDLRPLFPPMLHTVCLIYSNSEHYNSPARIIVLMKVKVNFFFDMVPILHLARKFATC